MVRKKDVFDEFNTWYSNVGKKQEQPIRQAGAPTPEPAPTPANTLSNTQKVTPNKKIIYPKVPSGKMRIEETNPATGEVTISELSQAENSRANRRANSNVGIREAEAKQQQQIIDQQNAAIPLVQGQPIDTNANLPTIDALDIGKIIGGGVAGAATGAAVGSIVPGIGTAIGGTVGAIGGLATTFFLSNSGEQKQYAKLQYSDFTQSTNNVDKIMNNANSQFGSSQQNRIYMDEEITRIEQTRVNLKKQSEGIFGEKLSANQEERAKIEAWIRNWERYGKIQFEMALQYPNPQMTNSNLGVQDEITQ